VKFIYCLLGEISVSPLSIGAAVAQLVEALRTAIPDGASGFFSLA
jgi:hypothetical protein